MSYDVRKMQMIEKGGWFELYRPSDGSVIMVHDDGQSCGGDIGKKINPSVYDDYAGGRIDAERMANTSNESSVIARKLAPLTDRGVKNG